MSNENSFSSYSNQPDSLISEMSISQTPKLDQFSFLSEKDMEEINTFVNKIDITNHILVINYGEYYQSQLANMLDTFYKLSNKIDTERIHASINQTTQVINEFLLYQSHEKNSFTLRRRFKKDMNIVRELKNELGSQFLNLDDNNDALSDCYLEIHKLYIMIAKYIVAGEKRLDQVKKVILPELKANSYTSFSSAEEYSKMMQCVNDFKEKMHSLYTSLLSASQSEKMIEVQKDNNNTLKRMINGILNNTIPAFEQCIII